MGPKPRPLSADRATYLEHAYELLRAELLPEAPPLAQVALAWSFPSKGARGRVIGQCFDTPLTGSHETKAIVIHPSQWSGDETAVLAVLAHEMVHAALGHEVGHKRPFPEVCRRIGLDGKPTATVPGEAFTRWSAAAAKKLPPFPAGGLTLVGATKKQGTRMRLWECACPIKIRAAHDDLEIVCQVCGEAFTMKQGATPDTPGTGAVS